jgi:hypothetical protein
MSLDIPLSVDVERLGREQAAQRGMDPARYAAEIVGRAVLSPGLDEVLAPFRKQVSESGLSDAQIDEFYRDLLKKTRSQRKSA